MGISSKCIWAVGAIMALTAFGSIHSWAQTFPSKWPFGKSYAEKGARIMAKAADIDDISPIAKAFKYVRKEHPATTFSSSENLSATVRLIADLIRRRQQCCARLLRR